MQVQNINPQNHNTNFKAIKNIKIDGLYKKYPSQAKQVLEKFVENEKAQAFCNKYNVDIILTTVQTKKEALVSKLIILYDNPLINNFKKILNSLFGKREKIEIVPEDKVYEHYESTGIKKTTEKLINCFSNITEKKDGCSITKCILNDLIEQREKQITLAKTKRINETFEKKISKISQKQKELQLKKEQEKLNMMIYRLKN